MLTQIAPLTFCVLWLLVCARLYFMISRENVTQRRLIAIGAGLSAGLIYIVGSLIVTVLTAPPPAEPPSEVQQVEDVRVMGREQ